jgi:hypothetical protein
VLLHASQSLLVRQATTPVKDLLAGTRDDITPITDPLAGNCSTPVDRVYLSMMLGTTPVPCKVISTRVTAQLPSEAGSQFILVAVKVGQDGLLLW